MRWPNGWRLLIEGNRLSPIAARRHPRWVRCSRTGRRGFTRLDPSQWKSARATNAIERLNDEFRRRIKTKTVLPCAETVPIMLWALLASGQIQMRRVDGWETLSQPIQPMPLDLAA